MNVLYLKSKLILTNNLKTMENKIEKFKPRRGDKVIVWYDKEDTAEELIFLTEIEGAKYPYNCVSTDTEEDFINGNPFHTNVWKNMKPIQIQKDTLVWVKGYEDSLWLQRFYSHFSNGMHYCFDNQKKSNEIENTTSWNIVTTENPFE
jgi:hypothetical protein